MTGKARTDLLDSWPSEDGEEAESAPASDPKALPDPLAQKLRTITQAAPKLREAGVLRVTAEGISFEMLPWFPPAPAGKPEDDEDQARGGLHDPALYPGGRVPRLEPPPPRRPRSEEPYDGDES